MRFARPPEADFASRERLSDSHPKSAITFLRCGRCAEREPDRVPDSLGCAYLRAGEVNVVLSGRADRRVEEEQPDPAAHGVHRLVVLRCRSCGFRRVLGLKRLRPLLLAGYPTIHIGPHGRIEGVVAALQAH